MDRCRAQRASEADQVAVPVRRIGHRDVEGLAHRFVLRQAGANRGHEVVDIRQVADPVAVGAEIAQPPGAQEAGDAPGPLLAAGSVDAAGPQDRRLAAVLPILLHQPFGFLLRDAVAADRRDRGCRLRHETGCGAVDRHARQVHQPAEAAATRRVAQRARGRHHRGVASGDAVDRVLHAGEGARHGRRIRRIAGHDLDIRLPARAARGGDRVPRGIPREGRGEAAADETGRAHDEDAGRGRLGDVWHGIIRQPQRRAQHAAGGTGGSAAARE